MAIVTQSVTLYILDNEPKATVFVVQGDTGRALLCKFKRWSVPAGATAVLYVETPTGAVEDATCTNNGDGTVTAPLSAAMLADAGEARGMVEITSGTVATSFEFALIVRGKVGS